MMHGARPCPATRLDASARALDGALGYTRFVNLVRIPVHSLNTTHQPLLNAAAAALHMPSADLQTSCAALSAQHTLRILPGDDGMPPSIQVCTDDQEMSRRRKGRGGVRCFPMAPGAATLSLLVFHSCGRNWTLPLDSQRLFRLPGGSFLVPRLDLASWTPHMANSTSTSLRRNRVPLCTCFCAPT